MALPRECYYFANLMLLGLCLGFFATATAYCAPKLAAFLFCFDFNLNTCVWSLPPYVYKWLGMYEADGDLRCSLRAGDQYIAASKSGTAKWYNKNNKKLVLRAGNAISAGGVVEIRPRRRNPALNTKLVRCGAG